MAITALPGLPAFAQETTFPNATEAPTAQTVEECRIVNIDSGGLNVRQQPSLTSSIVGVLADGADVSIENQGYNGWVPITQPFNGFVAAEYLTFCGGIGGPAPIPDNCREVDASAGLNVRQSPSTNSAVIDVLADSRTVNIANRGTGGWVPLESPVQGYVYGAYLNYCSPAQADRLQ
ncbi:SH3 domain-containing protein [Oculatella sp. LEGE 06141]|nr:SH3 domain-containing protein [Oculatella sp. LEGE 06141]MBE9182493.1 SH3 domain-containing protein [Oculatella sp. LEGE 06141]